MPRSKAKSRDVRAGRARGDARGRASKRAPKRAPKRRGPAWTWLRRGLLGTLALVLAYEVWLLVRVVWMRNHDPRWTAMMDEREDEVEDFEVDIRWQPLSRISPHLVRAVIAAEDVNFIEHSGIDWYAVWDAVQTNRSEGQVVRGGSTITQQLAKNLFLSSWQSYIRKAQEAVVAYELEAFVGKRRIMEIYLNVIEWDDGIYGAEAAARHYFRRSARSLTPEQAAYLAAIIPGPRKAFNPRKSPRRHAQAHRRIRNAMRHVKAPEFES